MSAPDYIGVLIAYRTRRCRQARPRVRIVLAFGTWTKLDMELPTQEALL